MRSESSPSSIIVAGRTWTLLLRPSRSGSTISSLRRSASSFLLVLGAELEGGDILKTVKRGRRWKRIRASIVWTADSVDPDKVADSVIRMIDRREATIERQKERSSPEGKAIREMERYFKEREDDKD